MLKNKKNKLWKHIESNMERLWKLLWMKPSISSTGSHSILQLLDLKQLAKLQIFNEKSKKTKR